ncbi:MAG: lipoyl synthase [Deltaproteobacteria bacterium]|nr:lipoyl synthase [Deltaproteobacteria bacterium]
MSDRLPRWVINRGVLTPQIHGVKAVLRARGLHSVCEEARCPNIGECFARGTATFMILGDVCTRSCGFCAVKTGRPTGLDWEDPERVARAVQALGLRHVVITSVNRDEREDGGAPIFAETIRAIRRLSPGSTVEILTPDFKGSRAALESIFDRGGPDIYNHNVETVPRLYRQVRPQAVYERSLGVLAMAKSLGRGIPVKSGLMVGLGETRQEVAGVMRDLRAAGCDILTIGQYLRPTRHHLPVAEYVPPEVFRDYEAFGRQLGFPYVFAGPLVRSSYNAEEAMRHAREQSAVGGAHGATATDGGSGRLGAGGRVADRLREVGPRAAAERVF